MGYWGAAPARQGQTPHAYLRAGSRACPAAAARGTVQGSAAPSPRGCGSRLSWLDHAGPSRGSGAGDLMGPSLLHRGAPGQAPGEWTGEILFYLLQPKAVPGLPALCLKAPWGFILFWVFKLYYIMLHDMLYDVMFCFCFLVILHSI